MPEVGKEIHKDPVRKYQLHGRKVEAILCSFDQGLRTKVIKTRAADGLVSKQSTDRSMGNVFQRFPEANLHDITEHRSDFFLVILKFRAAKSLQEQQCEGPNHGL